VEARLGGPGRACAAFLTTVVDVGLGMRNI
jgi:hypothetical protein